MRERIPRHRHPLKQPEQQLLPLNFEEAETQPLSANDAQTITEVHYDRGDTELEDRAERVAEQLGYR